MELGGLLWTSVLNLALPRQWHSPDAWLEHQESGGLVVRIQHFHCRGLGSIPGGGTEIPKAVRVWGSPVEAGGVALSHCEDKDTGSRSSGKYSLA